MNGLAQYKKYESYKDSGVEWIGMVPESWEVAPAKYTFGNVKRVVGKKQDQYERLALTMKGVIKRDKEANDGLQPADFESYQIVKENELIFKLIDLENIKTSRVGISKWEGLVSPAYIILSSFTQDNSYYHYYYLSLYFQNIYKDLGQGVRSSLNAKELLKQPLISPSIIEQTKIANFLDRETAKLDGLISKKQRLIELLKEKRQALITHAVTKGLDPNAKMKDSGIEWIGEIPDGWTCKDVKFVFDINKRTLGEKEKDDLEINYIDISNVNSFGEILEIQTIEFKDAPSRARRIVRTGDTIVSTVRTYLRAIAYISSEYDGFICSTGYAVLTPTKKVFNRFAKYAILSNKFIDEVVARSYGVSYPAITSNELGCIEITLPSYEDQIFIANHLDEQTLEIDSLFEKINTQIIKIREYRQALITAAVTGKIDVRDEVTLSQEREGKPLE